MMIWQIRIRTQVGALAVLAAVGFSVALARSAQAGRAEPKDKGPATVEFACPELATLELLIGPWRVTQTHYNARGEQTVTLKGNEEIAWILDHRAIRRTYTTRTDTTAYEAIGTLTYNQAEKTYHGVWFYSYSLNGPSTVRGEWDPEGRMFIFTMESLDAEGREVRYKTIEEFPDEETRVATTYELKGDEVIKKVEVRYKRYIPCPPGVRAIFDGA